MNELVKSYGWTMANTPGGIELYNRRGMMCAIVKQRGKRFISYTWDGVDKIASAPTPERAAEIAMHDYFCAIKVTGG